jgi:S-adenosylmethionine:tRNA ribosyltransferase-isomerase
MDIAEFDYELPPEAIAQEPLPERDASRLLVLDRQAGRLRHQRFRDLPELLAPGDLLVVNRSRVFPARLLGHRVGGGKAEILLLRRLDEGCWEALVRPGRRLRPGHQVQVGAELTVRIESEAFGAEGRRRVSLLVPAEEEAARIDRTGHVPLPPYIRREDRPADRDRYQTVFARESGSVAAPTAGLHFTPDLLCRLEARGIQRAEVLLHVGPGTFRPVRAARVEDHRLEAEPYCIPAETAAALAATRRRGRRVVAVGTTTTRALEASAARHGEVVPETADADLVIVPGFRFRAVDAVVTNFHLPRSSLLLLVSAFAGREAVLAAYGDAIRAGYRFYSYGDAMLIL